MGMLSGIGGTVPATAAGLKTMVATGMSAVVRWNGQKLKKKGEERKGERDSYKPKFSQAAAEQRALEWIRQRRARITGGQRAAGEAPAN